MSAGKLTWGRRDWLGLMVLFLSSIAADVIGALLAVKGILPMGSVAAWVYGGWALGAFLGVRVAVRGRSGTVQASLLLAAGAYVLIWLVGLTVFGTAASSPTQRKDKIWGGIFLDRHHILPSPVPAAQGYFIRCRRHGPSSKKCLTERFS